VNGYGSLVCGQPNVGEVITIHFCSRRLELELCMGKNIIICCDGTNNAITGDQSNVLRLFRMLDRSEKQQVFYDSGVGTKADPTALWPWRRYLRKKFDEGVGDSIRDNVLDAYRFLMHCFSPDDKIYLFGFSRGAYTVRALAAMIKRCGLLSPEFAHLAEYAWAVFSDEDQAHDARSMFGGAARIKKVFSRPAEIHFVGVWDTVSSFGWLWDQLTLPNTANNDSIRHVRHALSIDEQRAFFRPNLFRPPKGQDCREMWFAGVHADVGGGYKADEAGLARIALCWMLCEAKACGLVIDSALEAEVLSRVGDADTRDEFAQQHDESIKRGWRLLGWLPRRAYDGSGKRRWRWPNRAARRELPECALIHSSVLVRMQNPQLNYKPVLPSRFTFVGFENVGSTSTGGGTPRH
jgi:uncharacterized protein (DUF2235 family)